ncbi:MFS transporter [Tsukamurella soli]|uniref:MFS transporter n=1 Tax=Tsukamurella soli TaxID=644556 RepID=UPI0031E84C72
MANRTGATSVDPGEARRWRNGVFVVFAVIGLVLASYLGRLPQIRDDLHASTLQVSMLTFGIAIGSVIGLVASGPVVSRVGSRRTLVVSLPAVGVTAIAAAAGAQAGVYVLTLAPLVLLGAAVSMSDVAMNLSGADNERALGRPVMPLFHASYSLGTVVGAVVAALAQAAHIGVLTHMVSVSAVLLVAGWFALRPLPYAAHDAGDHAPVSAAERWSVWRDPRTIAIGVVMLGMGLAEGSANDWLALAMVDDHHVSKPVGTFTFGLFVAAMTLGRVLGTSMLARFGRVRVLRACGVLAFVGLALVIFGPAWAAYVGVAAWGVGSSLGFPVGMSAAADDPRMAAARVSVVSTIGYVAFLAGPPVIGVLGQYFSILGGLVVVLVAIVAATVAAPAARERRGRSSVEKI